MYCIFRSYKRTKVIKFHCTNVCLTLYITFAYVKLKPCLIPGRLEAGCDEAGRGCLAGPVFAAAVILPEGFDHPLLDDSKKMTEKHRLEVREYIRDNAVAWCVAFCSPEEIDLWNILRASITAMHRALDGLSIKPDFILIDGNKFYNYHPGGGCGITDPCIPHGCFVKGDSRFAPIAAASVLAKTCRDEYMEGIHFRYPEYNWNINKGYPTPVHRKALAEFGPSPYHRKSFKWQ